MRTLRRFSCCSKRPVSTLAGLRLPDGALVLRIARGRKSGQVRIPDADADAADAARCALAARDDSGRRRFPRESRSRGGGVYGRLAKTVAIAGREALGVESVLWKGPG